MVGAPVTLVAGWAGGGDGSVVRRTAFPSLECCKVEPKNMV